MKQVLFILLVFISFQAIAQESVKVKEIGLEVMKKDLGEMTVDEAKEICEAFGGGWRLPTIEELKKMYKYKDFIGGFEDNLYWSSSVSNAKGPFYFYHSFYYDTSFDDSYNDYPGGRNAVRVVRDLK